MESNKTIVKLFCPSCKTTEFREVPLIMSEEQKAKIRFKKPCSNCNLESNLKALAFFEGSDYIKSEEISSDSTELELLNSELLFKSEELEILATEISDLTKKIEEETQLKDSMLEKESRLQSELEKHSVIVNYLNKQVVENNLIIEHLTEENKKLIIRKDEQKNYYEQLVLENVANQVSILNQTTQKTESPSNPIEQLPIMVATSEGDTSEFIKDLELFNNPPNQFESEDVAEPETLTLEDFQNYEDFSDLKSIDVDETLVALEESKEKKIKSLKTSKSKKLKKRGRKPKTKFKKTKDEDIEPKVKKSRGRPRKEPN